ncbi:hypothetical protein [Longispora sp. NPDC051575]|uniref:hypothetical protein n=1 Tax=Longispora sp. NPDC051575 TaxID=3154943 RepID=UPI003443C38C
MDGFLTAVVTFAVYGGIAGGLGWLALRARRRGTASAALGVFDEIYRPTAAETRIEIQIQAERSDPVITPDKL